MARDSGLTYQDTDYARQRQEVLHESARSCDYVLL